MPENRQPFFKKKLRTYPRFNFASKEVILSICIENEKYLYSKHGSPIKFKLFLIKKKSRRHTLYYSFIPCAVLFGYLSGAMCVC